MYLQNPSKKGGGFRSLPLAVLLSTMMAVPFSFPQEAWGQGTCGGVLGLGYCDPVAGCPTLPPNFALVGDTVRVSLMIGSASITGGILNQLTVHRVRHHLDCDIAFPLGIPCTDDGPVVQYDGDGTITTDCTVGGLPVTWSTGHPIGPNPNEVVFTANPPPVIPANTFPFCSLEFNVTILTRSNDATPNRIEQVAGYSGLTSDVTCDNGLASSASQSGAITLCPQCPEPVECEEEGVCSRDTGLCLFPPKDFSTPCTDIDGNDCTVAGCNGQGVCDQNHVVKVAPVDECNLGCNPATGLNTPKPPSTPCRDTDNNLCTLAGCELVTPELGVCVQTHVFTPNSTPCFPDTDGLDLTIPGCDGLGVCDQGHIVESQFAQMPEIDAVCDDTSLNPPPQGSGEVSTNELMGDANTSPDDYCQGRCEQNITVKCSKDTDCITPPGPTGPGFDVGPCIREDFKCVGAFPLPDGRFLCDATNPCKCKWWIRLKKKPLSDINIIIKGDVFKPQQRDPMTGVTETGCFKMPTGEEVCDYHLVPRLNCEVTAGPFQPGDLFPLAGGRRARFACSAFPTTSLGCIGMGPGECLDGGDPDSWTGVVPLRQKGVFLDPEDDFHRRIILKGFFPSQVVIRRPRQGRPVVDVNAEGFTGFTGDPLGTEFTLLACDFIHVSLQVPKHHPEDVILSRKSVRLDYVGLLAEGASCPLDPEASLLRRQPRR